MNWYKVSFALVFCSLALFFQDPAHAGLADCFRWLSGKPQSENAIKRKAIRQAKQDFRAYVSARRRQPQTPPPVSRYAESTSNFDLVFGFHYWWFPGNVWHSMMIQDYRDLGRTVSEEHSSSERSLPTPADLPQPMPGDLDLPLNLLVPIPSYDNGGGVSGNAEKGSNSDERDSRDEEDHQEDGDAEDSRDDGDSSGDSSSSSGGDSSGGGGGE